MEAADRTSVEISQEKGSEGESVCSRNQSHNFIIESVFGSPVGTSGLCMPLAGPSPPPSLHYSCLPVIATLLAELKCASPPWSCIAADATRPCMPPPSQPPLLALDTGQWVLILGMPPLLSLLLLPPSAFQYSIYAVMSQAPFYALRTRSK